MQTADLIGAIVTVVIYILVSLIFVVRLTGRRDIEERIGIVFLLCSVPLVYLLCLAPEDHRPPIYYVQIGLMLVYMGTELVLDYILKIDFRSTGWAVIAYVTLFFAGTGGMLGVATAAGPVWATVSIVLFLSMGALAFVQRAKTGM